jgi:hypothetical protein
LDVVRILVARQLPRAAHNAPLHLFSASPELVGFGRGAYRQHSERTSRLLRQLWDRYHEEKLVMPFTMEDFDRWYFHQHFGKLTVEEQREVLQGLPPERRRELLQSLSPAERREVLQSLPPEERLAGLSAEQIRRYLDQLTAARPRQPRQPRHKR